MLKVEKARGIGAGIQHFPRKCGEGPRLQNNNRTDTNTPENGTIYARNKAWT